MNKQSIRRKNLGEYNAESPNALNLPFDETPKVVSLSATAKAIFKEWYDKLADQMNCGGSSFAGIATKMDRYCGRLALGLEVMKYGCKESKLEENGHGLR